MANIEQLFFDNIPAVREDKPGSTNPDDNKAAELIAEDATKRIGTAIMLRTMPGDRFVLSADTWYDRYEKSDENVSLDGIVTSLLGALLGGQTYEGIPVSELPHNVQIVKGALENPLLADELSNVLNLEDNPDAPKSHLNYLFFDEQFNLVKDGSGSVQVPQGLTGWTNITPATFNGEVLATVPGYVIIYVSNQSIGTSVWFDDVEHYNSMLLEDNHYYPFGLTINLKAGSGITPNPYKYQGIELEKNFGLETYETFYRGLDPQLGRFNGVDPKAEVDYSISPYASMANNPSLFVDPLGDENVVYMINLPNSGMSNDQFKTLQNSLNSKMKEFELDIQFVAYEGDVKDFKMSDISSTDAVSVYGSDKDVSDYIQNNLGNYFYDSDQWGSSQHPGATNLNVSGIDVEGVKSLAEQNNSDFNTAATFISLHESGHPDKTRYGIMTNNGHSYSDNNALNWDGAYTQKQMNSSNKRYGSYNQLMDKSNNSGYIKSRQNFFNAGYSRDNRALRIKYPELQNKSISVFMSTLLK